MLTVADRISDRRNNFGLIRFVAASLVVFSHAYPLTGHITDEPLARLVRIMDFASAAVIIFFVVSGFLVTRSAFLSTTSFRFVQSRLLRIWPALIVTAVVTAFVLGPIATALPLAEYFSAEDTWLYAIAVPFLDVGRFLPGTFLTNPLPRGVNGSLWTLQVEAWLYFVVGCLVLLRVTRHRAVFNSFVLVALTAYFLFPAQIVEWIPRHDAFMTPRLVGSFILGALVYSNAKLVPLNFLSGLALIVISFLTADTPFFGFFFYLTFGYWVILIALHPALYVARWNDRVDYSYGIYVFAFPIQQTLVALIGPVTPLLLFAVCYPLIVAAAAVSWWLVESKALALKSKAPGVLSR